MVLEYKRLDETIKMRTKLIDILEKNFSSNGAIQIKKIAKEMDRSVTWVNNAIKQLNTEDICINGNQIMYKDIRNRGVYSKIIKMVEDSEKIFPIFWFKDEILCIIYGVSKTTVYMYREFLRDNLDDLKIFWFNNFKCYNDMITNKHTKENETNENNIKEHCYECNLVKDYHEKIITVEEARVKCENCNFGNLKIYKFDTILQLLANNFNSDQTNVKKISTYNRTGKKETYTKRYGKAITNLQCEGKTVRQIAETLGISPTSVVKVSKQLREREKPQP